MSKIDHDAVNLALQCVLGADQKPVDGQEFKLSYAKNIFTEAIDEVGFQQLSDSAKVALDSLLKDKASLKPLENETLEKLGLLCIKVFGRSPYKQ